MSARSFPGVTDVVRAIAKDSGETVQVHGAEAARRLGLTAQAPTTPVYHTKASSRAIRIGNTSARLIHTANCRRLQFAGAPAGLAPRGTLVSRQESCDPADADKMRTALPPEEFEKLCSADMPAWMRSVFDAVGHGRCLWLRRSCRSRPRTKKDVLETAAARLDRSVAILEKDVCICWVLQTLFAIPNPHPMALKGGTSLSKVYGIIDRCSEDIGLTLDCRAFDDAFDSVSPGRQQRANQAIKPPSDASCRRLPSRRRRACPSNCGGGPPWRRPARRQGRRGRACGSPTHRQSRPRSPTWPARCSLNSAAATSLIRMNGPGLFPTWQTWSAALPTPLPRSRCSHPSAPSGRKPPSSTSNATRRRLDAGPQAVPALV